jgi:phosphatidylcholine synthase
MTELTTPSPAVSRGTPGQRFRAYAVHVYTASGVALAFAAALEMTQAEPDVRYIFALLFATVFIDATDGPLARRWEVKRWAARIDGRTIDDIVDYLTFTFLPLLLIGRMGWLPEPVALWIVPALIASLFGFGNREAKDETDGFFLGFPSYWNVVAFYAGFASGAAGAWFNAGLLLALAVLTLAPVRFLYPNLAPQPWKALLLIGGLAWVAVLFVMLASYPRVPGWLIGVSLIYPAFYTVLSIWLDRARPRKR